MQAYLLKRLFNNLFPYPISIWIFGDLTLILKEGLLKKSQREVGASIYVYREF